MLNLLNQMKKLINLSKKADFFIVAALAPIFSYILIILTLTAIL